MMNKRWTRTAVLLFLMLMVGSCATAPQSEKSDQDRPQKSEDKKLEKSEKKNIRKIAKEITEDRNADFYQTGMVEFNKGDYKDAVEAFKKAVDENFQDYKAYYALGRTYEKLNKAKEAEAAYQGVVMIKPGYLPAREALGLFYFNQKQFKEAEKHLQEARTLKSEVAEIYYCLGEIEQRENNCTTAIIAYKQALKLNPDYVAASNGLKVAEDACQQGQRQQPRQPPNISQPR